MPFIIDQPLAKYLLIRDYSSIPNILQFQYESECVEAKYENKLFAEKMNIDFLILIRRCRDRYANYSKDLLLTNIP